MKQILGAALLLTSTKNFVSSFGFASNNKLAFKSEVKPRTRDFADKRMYQVETKVSMTDEGSEGGFNPSNCLPVACKKWQTDNDPEEYWFNGKIHALGNTGTFGALHAAMGPISTKLIDKLAYKGLDVRSEVAKKLRGVVGKSGAHVLDMGCGVGLSTRALKNAFHDAEDVLGVDTSPEMVEMAQLLSVHDADLEKVRDGFNLQTIKYFLRKCARRLRRVISRKTESTVTFLTGNAESTTFSDESFDLVTVMYALHEAPSLGRSRIFHEARRLLRPGGTLAVIDISPEYKPSKSMLMGEPYMLEYQKNIHDQLGTLPGFGTFHNETVVPGHVEMWTLKRDKLSEFAFI